MTAGYVARVPNLNQQETLALAAYILFSFRLYRLYGGRSHNVFDETRLLAECQDFLVCPCLMRYCHVRDTRRLTLSAVGCVYVTACLRRHVGGPEEERA